MSWLKRQGHDCGWLIYIGENYHSHIKGVEKSEWSTATTLTAYVVGMDWVVRGGNWEISSNYRIWKFVEQSTASTFPFSGHPSQRVSTVHRLVSTWYPNISEDTIRSNLRNPTQTREQWYHPEDYEFPPLLLLLQTLPVAEAASTLLNQANRHMSVRFRPHALHSNRLTRYSNFLCRGYSLAVHVDSSL